MELPILPLLTKGDIYSHPPLWWTSAGPLHTYIPQSPTQSKQFKRYVSTTSQGDKNKTIDEREIFEVHIDVVHFKPEEISVKLGTDNQVTIEAKHEDRADEHGVISRYFMRQFEIPNDCDLRKLESKLSSDGVLIVTAPKKEVTGSTFTTIPIKIVSST